MDGAFVAVRVRRCVEPDVSSTGSVVVTMRGVRRVSGCGSLACVQSAVARSVSALEPRSACGISGHVVLYVPVFLYCIIIRLLPFHSEMALS